MPWVAHSALAASILLSALGAVVICVLVIAYGFATPGEDAAPGAARRMLLTRLGHAVAATCFAATGILALVAFGYTGGLMSSDEVVSDAPAPGAEPGRGSQMEARLAEAETRLGEVERATRRLGDDAGQAAGRLARLERAAPTERPARRVAPPSVAPAPAAREPVADAAPAVPLPTADPVAPPAFPAAPPAPSVPAPPVVGPPAPAVSPRAVPPFRPEERAAADRPAEPAARADLRAKVREDLERAGDRLMKAIDDLARRVGLAGRR
jgi:hypothetical protein